MVADATAEATLRAGDFLQTPTFAPGGLIESEMTFSPTLDESGPIASLKDLEPMASSVAEKREPSPVPPPSASGSRGLEWYLKNRPGGQGAGSSAAAAAPAPMPAAPADSPRGNPELIGFEQSSSYAAAPAPAKSEPPPSRPVPKPEPLLREQKREQKKEAELFAYIQGEKASPPNSSGSGISFAKRAIVPAVVLAAIAILAAPQAPWHRPTPSPRIRT